MRGQSQQTHTKGGCRKTTLRQGWWRKLLLHNSFIPEHLTTILTMLQSPFDNRLVVCQTHDMPAWIVLCPIIPGTRHWRGLTSTEVTKPYAALTPVQDYRPVQPHNSIRGQQILPTTGTCTQPSTLLVQRVPTITVLCPQIIGYIQGRLRSGSFCCTTFAMMQIAVQCHNLHNHLPPAHKTHLN